MLRRDGTRRRRPLGGRTPPALGTGESERLQRTGGSGSAEPEEGTAQALCGNRGGGGGQRERERETASRVRLGKPAAALRARDRAGRPGACALERPVAALQGSQTGVRGAVRTEGACGLSAPPSPCRRVGHEPARLTPVVSVWRMREARVGGVGLRGSPLPASQGCRPRAPAR